MSTELLLDTLLCVIALLFIPIGLRRGVEREVFVTAAVLAGAQLSVLWAGAWGADLEREVNLRVGVGQFTIAALFLIGTTLFLGYGGAAALRRSEVRMWGRLAGAELAVINGILLTAFLLRDIRNYLPDVGTERALERSRIARTLLEDFGWVMVGSAAAMLVTILFSLLIGGRAEETLAAPIQTGRAWSEPPVSTARKPRLAWGNDDGKVEPSARAFDAVNGRYGADAPSLQETMPIGPVDGSMWSPDRARTYVNQRDDEWLHISGRSLANWPARVETRNGPDSSSLCPACGESLTNDDMFCPNCGRARQAAH